MTGRLHGYKRIALKIGSAILVDQDTGLREQWLHTLAGDIARMREAGHEFMIVSSGAIALGRRLLNLPPRQLRLEESQAAAACGQIALAHAWNAAFAAHGIATGQILVTFEDTENRRRYLNARATMQTLFGFGAIPVINENDTVATAEIRYGDNDRLAARVATMLGCELLILLSDIDGLYTAPPARDPDAQHLAEIAEITPEIEAMAGDPASLMSRGGMRTKLDAGRIATRAGTAMIIADGRAQGALGALDGGARCTLFHAAAEPVSAWKNWIGGQLETRGTLVIDAGAAGALRDGRSLLPAGIRSVTGHFERGDTVLIVDDATGQEVARGLAGYDHDDLRIIAGLRSGEIEAALGAPARGAAVHRDHLVISGARGPAIAAP